MNYILLCFQTSGRHIIFFSKHDYQVSTSLMEENRRYMRVKTAKWISIWKLVPGLLLTVRSAGMGLLREYQNQYEACIFFWYFPQKIMKLQMSYFENSDRFLKSCSFSMTAF